jgi:hypothetical protein
MADFMKPNPHRRSTSHGVGLDGKPRARVPNSPGQIANPDRTHEAQQDNRTNIALAGAPKRHQNVALAGSMTEQQRAGHQAGGLGHPQTASVCDEPLSLTPTVAKNYPIPKAANKGAS